MENILNNFLCQDGKWRITVVWRWLRMISNFSALGIQSIMIFWDVCRIQKSSFGIPDPSGTVHRNRRQLSYRSPSGEFPATPSLTYSYTASFPQISALWWQNHWNSSARSAFTALSLYCLLNQWLLNALMHSSNGKWLDTEDTSYDCRSSCQEENKLLAGKPKISLRI